MSYTCDHMAWAERVTMENGAQNRFLDRVTLQPVYFQTVQDRFNYLNDYETGSSNPNLISSVEKDIMRRS
jgi:hypothetical protein